MSKAVTKQSVEAAWAKAAECSSLMDEAVSPESKKMYETLRDSWIEVANNLQSVDRATYLRRNGELGSLMHPRITGRGTGVADYSAKNVGKRCLGNCGPGELTSEPL